MLGALGLHWNQIEIHEIALALATTLAVWSFLSFIKNKLLRRVDQHSRSDWGKALLKQTRWPFRFFLAYLGVLLGLLTAPSLTTQIPALATAARVVGLLLGLWLLDGFLFVLIHRLRILQSLSSNSRSLLIVLHRVFLVAIAILIILDLAGITITPLLASLGVGSVAVALALQDTLSNFFSGLYILMDRPVRVGDYVQINGDVEGYIEKIGWRSTHIRLLVNNTMVVPNSKISGANVLNYNIPVTEMSFLVPVGVSYSSRLKEVERVAYEVAVQAQKTIPGGVPSFEPLIRFFSFGNSSIDFNVILRAQTYEQHFLMKHEFIKALHERFEKEGIEIPFPQRVVHMAPSVQEPRA